MFQHSFQIFCLSHRRLLAVLCARSSDDMPTKGGAETGNKASADGGLQPGKNFTAKPDASSVVSGTTSTAAPSPAAAPVASAPTAPAIPAKAGGHVMPAAVVAKPKPAAVVTTTKPAAVPAPKAASIQPTTTYNKPTVAAAKTVSTASSKSSVNSSTNHNGTNGAANTNGKESIVNAELQQQNLVLMTEVNEMKTTLDGLEKERDFYFGKLRDIEVLCQEYESENLPALKKILDILYFV